MDTISNYELLRLETLAKVKACVNNGYPKQEFNAAIDAIKRLHAMATSVKVKKSWEAFAMEFSEGYNRYHAAAATAQPVAVGSAPTRDYSADYPIARCADMHSVGMCDPDLFADNCTADKGNIFAVEGVYMADLLLQLREYAVFAQQDMRVLDMDACPADRLVDVVQWLVQTHLENNAGGIVVLSNAHCMGRLPVDAQSAICRALSRATQPPYSDKVRFFLLSADPTFDFGRLYQRVCAPSDSMVDALLDSVAIECIVVRLPLYRSTKTLICQRFSVDENDDTAMALIRQKGVALGYNGLLCLIREGTVADWQTQLAHIYEANKQHFCDYLAKLGRANIGRVVDIEWGLRTEGIAPAPVATIGDNAAPTQPYRIPSRLDLDTIDDNDSIKSKIERIMGMETDANGRHVSLTARCGLVVRYAVTGGDPLRNIDNLSGRQIESVLSGRWLMAYAALSQLMRVPFGQLVFDIPATGDRNGECVSGGQKIRLSKRFLCADGDKLEFGCSTLLHEMYHALQAAARQAKRDNDVEALRYYWQGFQVSLGRIGNWDDNHNRYFVFDGDVTEENRDRYYHYADQVYEADARAFAIDAIETAADVVCDI